LDAYLKRNVFAVPYTVKYFVFIYSRGTRFLVECFFSYLIFLVERLKELFSNVRYGNSRQSFLSFGLAVVCP
ncbi:hypothetical protein ACQ1PZ_10570, partial [Ornithobacterium rhinotracheale]